MTAAATASSSESSDQLALAARLQEQALGSGSGPPSGSGLLVKTKIDRLPVRLAHICASERRIRCLTWTDRSYNMIRAQVFDPAGAKVGNVISSPTHLPTATTAMLLD